LRRWSHYEDHQSPPSCMRVPCLWFSSTAKIAHPNARLIESGTPKIGYTPQTLLKWIQRAAIDKGTRDRVTIAGREHVTALEREDKVLRRMCRSVEAWQWLVGEIVGAAKHLFRLTHIGLMKDTADSDRTSYSLRHTYATLELLAGTDIHALARQMEIIELTVDRHDSQLTATMASEKLARIIGFLLTKLMLIIFCKVRLPMMQYINWKSILPLFLLLTLPTSSASAQAPGQPANSWVKGSNWYCNSEYQN